MRKLMQQINIYYGGRGLIEDPTIYVMNKLTEVLGELNMEVKKYNLYEDKQGISVLPKTLKEADGVILAASVEWLGIRADFYSSFWMACWLYGDKDHIKELYMLPVGHRHYCRRKGRLSDADPCLGNSRRASVRGNLHLCSDHTDFETNPDYALLIEKKAESFYRSFSKKLKVFPSSTNSICENTLRPKTMQLTPQESEQLSMYVSDNNYVQKQKEDIEELTQHV